MMAKRVSYQSIDLIPLVFRVFGILEQNTQKLLSDQQRNGCTTRKMDVRPIETRISRRKKWQLQNEKAKKLMLDQQTC